MYYEDMYPDALETYDVDLFEVNPYDFEDFVDFIARDCYDLNIYDMDNNHILTVTAEDRDKIQKYVIFKHKDLKKYLENEEYINDLCFGDELHWIAEDEKAKIIPLLACYFLSGLSAELLLSKGTHQLYDDFGEFFYDETDETLDMEIYEDQLSYRLQCNFVD